MSERNPIKNKHMDPMPSGIRVYRGFSKLRIRRADALPERMRERTREIVELETHAYDQNKGYATKLMHKVCTEADNARIVLILMPQPFGSNIAISKHRLADWYAERFGFATIQLEPLLMARMPGATPRLLQLTPVNEALMKEKAK